jgi:uncharacterized GH25 family protein
MILRVFPALVIATAMNSAARSHDFWLQPGAYWTGASATTPVTLEVGDGATRQRSQVPTRRIMRFAAVAPDGTVTDLKNRLRTEPGFDARVGFDASGVHVLVLETDNRARSYLSAGAFNQYLRDEGLTPALELRSRTGRLSAGAAEKYKRCAKTMIQVGEPARTPDGAAPAGVSLEIVPEVNPYATPRPPALSIRVIYEGRPLGGASVKLTDLDRDIEPLETRITDRAGRAVFPMPTAGSWLLSTVWTQPLEMGDEADFETTFSSLSFGFPANGAAGVASLPP